MYDLFTDGLQSLKDLLISRTEKFAYQGMLGLTSGSNSVFQMPHHPLLSAETTAIYLNGVLLSSGSYALDAETGTVRFTTAPAEGVQPEATYYRCDYSDSVLKQIMVAAFRQMEMRWNRKFRLSSGSVTFVEASPSSTHAYVASPTTMADPAIAGTITFSSSQAQRGLLLSLAELTLLQAEGDQAAKTAFSFRESRGMAVDRSKVPSNILGMLEYRESAIAKALYQAQYEQYGTEGLGAFLSRELSDDYKYNFQWDADESTDATV